MRTTSCSVATLVLYHFFCFVSVAERVNSFRTAVSSWGELGKTYLEFDFFEILKRDWSSRKYVRPDWPSMQRKRINKEAESLKCAATRVTSQICLLNKSKGNKKKKMQGTTTRKIYPPSDQKSTENSWFLLVSSELSRIGVYIYTIR